MREALEREVEACLSTAMPQVDLLELTVIGSAGDPAIRAVVDHPDGVDHEVCERVTRALQAVGLGDRYGIEVWSPGPEPPLRTPEHYRRAIGHRVSLRVADDRHTRTREGLLSVVTADGVGITTATGVVDIPFGAIRRGRDLDGGERW
ncbi:MAG: hypothetical protein U0Y82_06615 [Thermoleophilia bacterium]